MSDLLKVRVGGRDYLCKWESKYVVVGDRKYKTVKIGSQLWMAENLDWKWSGLVIGSTSYPASQAAWYYQNNETDYGIEGTYKCGLLYNGYASQYLNNNKESMLPAGWHVPTIYEWDTLVTEIGGKSSAGQKLKALDNTITSNWPSNWKGIDEYNFGVMPCGLFTDNMFKYLAMSTQSVAERGNISGNHGKM